MAEQFRTAFTISYTATEVSMETPTQDSLENGIKRALEALFNQIEEKIGNLEYSAGQRGDLNQLRDGINETLMALNLGVTQILNQAQPLTQTIINFVGNRLSQLWGRLIGLFNQIANQVENWSISTALSLSIPSSTTFELTITFKP